MYIIFYLLLILTFTAIIYYCFAIWAALNFYFQPVKVSDDFLPFVTILKPLKGMEWELDTSLTSFFQQDYPQYELIFCLQDPEDPALEVVEKLRQQFPLVDCKTVINSQIQGNNLKISNLLNGYQEAKYEILVIADSDIQVTPDYLKRLVQPFQDPLVGVVTCLYNSLTKGWVAAFESLEIASQFQPRVLTARQLSKVNFSLGATIAIRQNVLAEIGGLNAVADYLADDYQLGYLPSQLGYQVVISDYIVAHRLADVNWQALIKRQIRWAKCIRVERFWSYLGLIFTQGTVTSLAFYLASNFSNWGLYLLIVTWGLRGLMAAIIGIFILQDQGVKKHFLWLPLRDFLSFGIWFYSLFGNQIEWRGQKFQLVKGGKLIAEGVND